MFCCCSTHQELKAIIVAAGVEHYLKEVTSNKSARHTIMKVVATHMVENNQPPILRNIKTLYGKAIAEITDVNNLVSILLLL